MSEPAIEEHEEAALTGVVATGLGGLMALFTLFMKRRPNGAARWTIVITLIVAVAAAALLARAANLGGQIRHPEIRGDFTSGDDSATG